MLIRILFLLFLQELSKTITKNIEDYGSDMIGCLISGQSTNEELFLFQKLFRSLLISNIDHRTNECDFDYQYDYPLMPSLNCDFNDIGSFDNIILLGVNIKSEFPILSIRLHEASKNKTKIHSINFKSTRTSLRPMMENFKLTSQTNIEDIDILNIEDILKKQNINKQKKNIIIVGPRISYLPNQSNILSMLKKLGETYAVKIQKAEGEINWNDDAKIIVGKINGLYPTPGAFFIHKGERYKVLKAEIGRGNGKPGEIISNYLEVICGDKQTIKIKEIQRQGKKPQSISEFMLGSQIKQGEVI